jgi:hypothetical protein
MTLVRPPANRGVDHWLRLIEILSPESDRQIVTHRRNRMAMAGSHPEEWKWFKEH